jgi:predicted TIM-barrel fold metal-dependent hydrolase
MAKSKFRWLKMQKKTAPELPLEPPIWLNNHSNGEYFHKQTPHEAKLRQLILNKADENARRVGMDRREFLASSMGMATSLWVLNACREDGDGAPDGGAPAPGADSGGYPICEDAMYDEAAACAALDGDEFIFDIQTHHFDPEGEWVTRNNQYLSIVSECGIGSSKVECVSRERYEELMFCDSDTTMAALSTWPAALCTEERRFGCGMPLPNASVAASRNLINMAANSQRIVNHVQIIPNDPTGVTPQLEMMEEMHACYGVGAWKLYPAWGPDGVGYWLDDPIGLQVIEKGRELGVKLFCIHKGLPIPGFDVEHNFPTDIGRVAAMFPDCKFVVYHSAICAGQSNICVAGNEGPYDPDNATRSVNTLIKSLEDNGIGPNENVYGEMGSSFSQVRNTPMAAQHYMGKLLKHIGEDNMCWGTDAILFGSPQGLIESLRSLTISEALQEEYGYANFNRMENPDLHAKVFGLNAAAVYGVDPEVIRCALPSCHMAQNKRALDEELGPRRWTAREPMGPKTRREFMKIAAEHKALGVPS